MIIIYDTYEYDYSGLLVTGYERLLYTRLYTGYPDTVAVHTHLLARTRPVYSARTPIRTGTSFKVTAHLASSCAGMPLSRRLLTEEELLRFKTDGDSTSRGDGVNMLPAPPPPPTCMHPSPRPSTLIRGRWCGREFPQIDSRSPTR